MTPVPGLPQMQSSTYLSEHSQHSCSTTPKGLDSVSVSTQDEHHDTAADQGHPSTLLSDHSSCDDQHSRRSSAFLEVGLGGNDAIVDAKLKRASRPKLQVRFRSQVDIVQLKNIDDLEVKEPFGIPQSPSQEMPFFFPTLPKLLFLALVIVLVIPSLHTSPLLKVEANPVAPRVGLGGVRQLPGEDRAPLSRIEKRQDTSTTVCKRWAAQSALVNGTLYYYGGRSTSSSSQSSDTWSEYPPLAFRVEVATNRSCR